MDLISEAGLATLAGALGGVVLGLAARLARFCTLGAIEDFAFGDDDRRLRLWCAAAAMAVLATFWLSAAGVAPIERSFYLYTAWNPLGSILGGLTFGYGMALAGTCGFGALSRLGGGDLRGLVIALIMGVSAAAALSGVLESLRGALFPVRQLDPGDTPAGLAHWGEALTGAPAWALATAAAGPALALLIWRGRPLGARPLFWSLGVGAAIASGWAVTGWLSSTGFDAVPVASHSYTAPLGEALLFGMTGGGLAAGFGVGSVFGVVAGGAIGAFWRGEFRWEACDDARELRRQMLGALLMGVGGVVAMGCTIGQGLTALSALALSAPVVMASIFLGAWFGLRQLLEGWSMPKELF